MMQLFLPFCCNCCLIQAKDTQRTDKDEHQVNQESKSNCQKFKLLFEARGAFLSNKQWSLVIWSFCNCVQNAFQKLDQLH